jgi:hypothetical protein
MSRKHETLHKGLATLKTSRGWTYIEEVMEKEIVGAALGMATNANMSVEEMHFRRGSIWAAKQLLDLPERLTAHLESAIALEAANLPDEAQASFDILTKSPPRPGEE